ncbi:DUF7695 domain-containing protein [Bacillus pumilus]|uniref:DUF7695 domain-containing protein n=1 Tax=Bacillus pumilus TaxID=1408 RepID=UPI003FCDA24F
MTKTVVRNAIQCKHCGEVIESKVSHEFRKCSCGKVSVDGGLEYPRRGFPEHPAENHYEELMEYGEAQGSRNRRITSGNGGAYCGE